MTTTNPDPPVLLVHWERSLGALLDCTRNFPKAVRFTFSSRIDNLGLDLLDRLVRARWAPRADKAALLAAADADLAVLRTLIRLSHDRRYLDRAALERLSRDLDEAGRMLGGWRRHLGTGP